jgi:TetR/AcrR family transcriptional regulator, transcriptional repressor for nem operon
MPTEPKQTRREQSHTRILDAAARALVRDGAAGVGVASVMKEAGLTHGGFYAHFESRDALLAEAAHHAGARSVERLRARQRSRAGKGASPLRVLIEGYLSDANVKALEEGCPIAALAGEMPRVEPGLRDAFARSTRDIVAVIEDVLPAGSPPGAALVIGSTMVGALQMARVLGKDRAAILASCRESLIAQYDRPGQP